MSDTPLVWNGKILTAILLKTFLIFIFSLFVAANTWGAVIYVDAANTGTQTGTSWLSAYADIMSAVENAAEGDEIWVKEGVYTRTPVESWDHHVVTNNGLSLNFYGGFPASMSSPQWDDRDWASYPTIITGNGITGDDWVRGFSLSGNPVVVDGFTIMNCAGDAYGGGGIRMTYLSGTSTIRNCVIKNNIGLDHCTGGGVQIANAVSATVNLVNCLIAGNTAQQGGGLYVYGKNNSGYPVNVINCTIANNQATDNSADYGGGIYNNNSYIHFRNSIIWGNTRANAAASGLVETTLGAMYSSVSYTLIQGGYAGAGNLDQDPYFISSVDLHLSASSPCIDRGLNSSLPADVDDIDDDADTEEKLPFDLDAGTRLIDGDGNNSEVVDMGSYEYGSSIALTLRLVRTSFIEGEQAYECALDISEAQGHAIDVDLASSDQTEITVPDAIEIPAGQTTVHFNMTIVDDIEFDDYQYATISASAAGVKSATSDVIEIIDNDTKVLTLNVPPTATEGDGVLADHGFVHLSGTFPTPTDVYLSSSNMLDLEVPEYVTIGSNTQNASFWIGVHDDDVLDGTSNVTITAWIPGDDDFNTASGAVSIADNEVPPTMYTLNMSVSGQGTTTPAAGAHNFAEDSEVQVSAAPASGWRFDGWSGHLTGTANPATVTMSGTRNVTANFSLIPPNYDLTVLTEGDGQVDINPEGLTYESGTTVHLEAVPGEGSVLIEWVGDVSDDDHTTTTILMNADKTVTARFGEDSDDDGLSDESEFGPDGTDSAYDGNGDGTTDADQANVTSGYTEDDTYYVTLACEDPVTHGAGNGTLTDIETDDPVNPPQEVDFPYGVFSFSIKGVGVGGQTTLVLYFNDGPVPESYWKYGPTPTEPTDHWYEFLYDGTTGAEIDAANKRIILHFVDGERGDDNVVAPDGDIVDDGAPTVRAPVVDTTPAASSGSSSSSCFINSLLF